MHLFQCLLCQFFLALFVLTAGNSQDSFITKWKTDNPGTSCENCIEIPTKNGGYNYQVDWGDGLGFDSMHYTGNAFHEYDIPGAYEVKIKGDFPRIAFYITNTDTFNSVFKIIDIVQWGDIQWTSMEEAFYGCDSLILSASDNPNLDNVNSTSRMFSRCGKVNADLNSWDVSQVEDMSRMFDRATSFNGDISNWNTSNVKVMSGLFSNATSFNSDISNWDVSSVTMMNQMFQSAISFLGDVNNWDVSNVTSMSQMFFLTENNLNLESWDVSSVTDMNGMFYQNRNFSSDLSSWDVSNVIRLDFMFRGFISFTSDLSQLNVSNVTDMRAMFDDNKLFESDLSQWNVSKVTDMSSLFEGCSIFTSDLSMWDVSNVTKFTNLFNGALIFESDLSSWDVSSVTNMNSTFRRTNNFSSDLSLWDVSNVTNMNAMFLQAKAFNGDIDQWDVSSVTSIEGMFELTDSFNRDIGSWNVSNASNLIEMFRAAKSFDQDLGSWQLSSVQDSLGKMLEQCGMSSINYENTLNGWAASSATPDNVILISGGLTYCDESGRNQLIEQGWSIRDDLKLSETEGCISSSDKEVISDINISIYPNPTNNLLVLESKLNLTRYKIMNLSGQSLITGYFYDSTMNIDVSNLSPSVYFLHCISENGYIIKSFAKI